MSLQALGYDGVVDDHSKALGLTAAEVGRISLAHRELYRVITANGERSAEITGNLRYSAVEPSDLPAVGDWVAVANPDDELAIIHAVLPRRTVLERPTPGRSGETQIIAANVDVAFIIQAVDRDFSVNRLERYLTLCHAGGVSPVIVISKIDLVEPQAVDRLERETKSRLPRVPVLAISNRTGAGHAALGGYLHPGQTGCFLGSSGVGKSTLLNRLAGGELMKTSETSDYSGRGKHTTSHRGLFLLERGGVLIDNPGMREVGVADAAGGLDQTFADIVALADACRFADCTHTTESGCAVIEAVERGEVDEATLANYLRMAREKQHFQSTVQQRRKRDRAFGRMVKSVKKQRKDRF